MTDPERVAALEAFGYTSRQVQFLLRVALHSGYFLRRQYVAFIARGHGLATARFLARTVARGHVQLVPAGPCGQLFHLSARPIYAALDQEDNRHRRQAEWAAVVRKLLTLDFVLSQPDAQSSRRKRTRRSCARPMACRTRAGPRSGTSPDDRGGVPPSGTSSTKCPDSAGRPTRGSG